ncbi:MAG: response regulator [Burkholderiaceae bacterium]|jgi:excisionase family DNA binding protein|nr:response regulator [Sulfuritalea sp.]MCF8175238.1 response regulator [Burkholderiaceae bacterium]MCF8183344.1 response regulator [Polynucleobacter sp.]
MSQATTIYCTTREAAEMLGVSLRTAQLWTESGLLEAWKTEGGHRRISRASVQRLLAREKAPYPDPGVAERRIARMKILVVEDDSVLLKLYKTVIAGWNLPLDVITAGNGVEGLIRVGRDTPDLMITDLSMPGMDGFELIHSLATSSFREGMEIVVVTGLDAADVEARGGLPDGVRVFPKPVPFAELRAIVAAMLERRASYL